MINAVLYSDQIISENENVDVHLLALLAGRGRRIGYIPSGADPEFRFFSEKKAYYARLGLCLRYFPRS